MTDPDTMLGHNGGPDHDIAGDERLRLLIERAENLIEEKKGIQEDLKEVFAEGKSVGYDPKIMKQVIKIRAMDANDRAEQEALLDTYLSALGL